MDIVPTGDIDDPCAFDGSFFQYRQLVVIGSLKQTLDTRQNLHTAHSPSLMTSLMTELGT